MVDRLSLTVRRGEFFSILGPSGAGKSSLLRLLAGFDEPDEGELLIAGQSMRGVPPNRRPVNLVFQHYALFPHLTVFGNVAFGLEMRKVPRRDILASVERALEMVKLSAARARWPHQLSGGEQQRVALARALVNRPAVVLLDEPLGALDQQLRQEMQGELKAIQRQVGLTFVAVTHHQEEALTMSDRLAVMHHGRLWQVGTPQEIYDTPTSTFVGSFIGLSNLLTGELSIDHGPFCTLAPPGLPPLIARLPVPTPTHARATLLLRPERLRFSSEGPLEASGNGLEGRVEQAVYNGSQIHYWVRLANGDRWRVHVANSGSTWLCPGQAIWVCWSATDGVLLMEGGSAG